MRMSALELCFLTNAVYRPSYYPSATVYPVSSTIMSYPGYSSQTVSRICTVRILLARRVMTGESVKLDDRLVALPGILNLHLALTSYSFFRRYTHGLKQCGRLNIHLRR